MSEKINRALININQAEKILALAAIDLEQAGLCEESELIYVALLEVIRARVSVKNYQKIGG